MTLFLSAKQIVDLLYQFKFLDYLMVVAAAGLVIYKAVKEYRVSGEKGFAGYVVSTVKKNFCLTDVLILILAVLVGLSLLRNLDGFSEACAIESAFLVYLLGRVYGKEVLKAGKYLAYVGYAIIYINGSYYLYKCIDNYTHNEYPWFGEADLKNGGALYYYKTDLGIAIVVASVFIYCFSKALVAKYITLCIVNVAFLFHTNAHTAQGIYVLFLLYVICHEIRSLILRKKKDSENKESDKRVNIKPIRKLIIVLASVFMLMILCTVCMLHFSPVKQKQYLELDIPKETEDKIENIFHSRHLIWWDTLHYMINSSPDKELLGTDLDGESFALHNERNMMPHSMYLSLLYGTGIIGIIALFGFLWTVIYSLTYLQKDDKELIFLIIATFVVFLVMGLTTDAIEYTQMSWFPFIFVGAGISIEKIYERI